MTIIHIICVQITLEEEDDKSSDEILSRTDSYNGLMEVEFDPPIRKSQPNFTPPSQPPMRKAYSDPMSSKNVQKSDQGSSYSDMYSSQYQAYSFYQPTPPPPPPAITPFAYSRSPTPSDSSSYYGGYGRGFDVSS